MAKNVDNYQKLVGVMRFELMASWSRTMRATPALHPEKYDCITI